MKINKTDGHSHVRYIFQGALDKICARVSINAPFMMYKNDDRSVLVLGVSMCVVSLTALTGIFGDNHICSGDAVLRNGANDGKNNYEKP